LAKSSGAYSYITKLEFFLGRKEHFKKVQKNKTTPGLEVAEFYFIFLKGK
jgi:hypothetical protein